MAARVMNPQLKMALDYGPVLLFGAAYFLFGIYPATAVLMIAISISVIVGISIERKFSAVPLVTGFLVLVFGGLTLWLQDPFFIKIKPTIFYTMLAAVLVGGLLFKRLLIKFVLAHAIQMTDAAWRTLTWRTAIFFLLLAAANEFVWRSFSEGTWVTFKLGIIPLMVLFTLSQVPFMLRHQIEERPQGIQD
jgi:intracellular septation protein